MAITSDLPPLVLELRARAGQLYSTFAKVKADTKAMAADTAASTAGMAAKTEAASASMSSRLASLGSHARRALLPIGLGAAAVGYEALKSATEFQRSTTLLVTAGGEAQSNLALVQHGIEQIAMATGENAQNLSDGMYIVEKAGMHGAAGLTVLKAAAQSAMAEGTDMPTMTNAITSALMSYGKGAGYAATMASQMDRAAGMAKTTMQQFAGSLSTVLPIASAAGVWQTFALSVAVTAAEFTFPHLDPNGFKWLYLCTVWSFFTQNALAYSSRGDSERVETTLRRILAEERHIRRDEEKLLDRKKES